MVQSTGMWQYQTFVMLFTIIDGHRPWAKRAFGRNWQFAQGVASTAKMHDFCGKLAIILKFKPAPTRLGRTGDRFAVYQIVERLTLANQMRLTTVD